jgi:hypothetical protein
VLVADMTLGLKEPPDRPISLRQTVVPSQFDSDLSRFA